MALRDLGALSTELAEWATSDIPRVPTGYSIFDSRTNGGIAPGEVALFLARSSVGKTWFVINMLNHNPSVPSIFFSLEMHGRYVLQRLTAVHTGVGTDFIENMMMQRGKADAVDQTVLTFPKLMCDDRPGMTLGDMLDSIDEYEEVHGERPRLIAIDYMELIKAYGSSQMETVDKLAWAVKDFARESDTAVVVLHQVKRGESKKGHQNVGHMPLTMTDARFGGEMAADYVFGMYKPDLDPELGEWDRQHLENDIRLQFLKTRSGGGIQPLGEQHFWDGRTGRIQELKWAQSDLRAMAREHFDDE